MCFFLNEKGTAIFREDKVAARQTSGYIPDFPLISLALRFLAFKRVSVSMELLGW